MLSSKAIFTDCISDTKIWPIIDQVDHEFSSKKRVIGKLFGPDWKYTVLMSESKRMIGLSDQDRAFAELLLLYRKMGKTSQKYKVLSEIVRSDKINGPQVSKIYSHKTV